MPRPWQALDLEGGGLQHLNSELARRRRRLPLAFALWLLFPLGAHRFYLDSPRTALGLPVLTALSLLGAALFPPAAVAGLVALAFWGIADLFWIPRRVPAVNKALRVALFMAGDAAPPPGYRGRYGDDDPEAMLQDYTREKERERAGHQPVGRGAEGNRRFPSFAEQERLLRAMADKEKPEKG